MRHVDVKKITEYVKELCIDTNYYPNEDIRTALEQAKKDETSPVGRSVISLLEENLKIAESEMIPICQDTGMAVIFLEIGQDVHFINGDITTAINEGVRQGYEKGYLRKSVVNDPLDRKNSNNNTPAIIHFSIVSGDKIKLTVAPKGFGSENMSRIFMLKPADGVEGIKRAVIETAKEAGPNACPPFVVGVGIGGDFEKCAVMAKHALTHSLEDSFGFGGSKAGEYKDLEKEILDSINATGLGPAGLGGKVSALAVNIESFATHIAGLPLAVNMCCHVCRHKTVIF